MALIDIFLNQEAVIKPYIREANGEPVYGEPEQEPRKCRMNHNRNLQTTYKNPDGQIDQVLVSVTMFCTGAPIPPKLKASFVEKYGADSTGQNGKLDVEYDDFEKVFSFDHLYNAYRKSRLSVRWKASTQRYIANALLYIQRTRQSLLDETFRSKGFCEFDLRERGKLRHIRSVEMQERVVQRCLCDYALIPMLSRSFIYCRAGRTRRGSHQGLRRTCQAAD